MKKLFFLLIIIFMFAYPAEALKISGRVIIPFEPGFTYEGELCIVPEKSSGIELQPTGELADSIEIEETQIYTDGVACVPYTIELPRKMERPGLSKNGIIAKELPNDDSANIVALVSLTHQIWVDVPYPGKYIESSFNALSNDAGEDITFNIDIASKGEEVIDKVTGVIKIYDEDNNLIGTIVLEDMISMQPGAKESITATWNSGTTSTGNYKAVLELEYDGEDAEAKEALFKIGSQDLKLHSHTEKIYNTGIVPFSVSVESFWSKTIENAKAFVEVTKDGTFITQFETLSSSIDPWSIKSLTGYLNTNGLALGTYDIKIKLTYSGGEAEYTGQFELAEEVVPKEKTPLNLTKVLLTTTIILALIALILGLKVIIGKRDKEEKEDNY